MNSLYKKVLPKNHYWGIPTISSPDSCTTSELRDIKQRTPEWINARKSDGSLSSSSLENAFGYWTVPKAAKVQADLWIRVSLCLKATGL